MRPSNFAVEQTAGSRSLARGCSPQRWADQSEPPRHRATADVSGYDRPAMLSRRGFLQAVGGSLLVAPPSAGWAQQVKRIGFLRVGPPPQQFITGLRQGLREQGLAEGRNVLIEWGLAESVARLPDALAGLMRLNVDVLVASGTSSVVLTRNAARTIPVVFVAAVDPVAMGLVKSLARPGGTVTGFTAVAEELNGKRLELLRQLLPNFSSVAFLVRLGSPATPEHTKEAERAAGTLGVRLQVVAARDHSELEKAISAARDAGALLVVDDSVFTTQRTKIAELALRNRLPTMYGHRDMVQAGGLMTYGPDYGDLYRRAAGYVQKILQGAKPGDLPIEQPTKFEFVINLKMAKALGLTVPPSLLARADHVIE
jgi:putative ABC transport system substrate-binding protein